MRFDENPLTCQCEREDKGLMASGFELLLVVFKRHGGSEGVKAVGGQIQVTHLLTIVNKTLWQVGSHGRHIELSAQSSAQVRLSGNLERLRDVGQNSSITVLPSQPYTESSIVTFLFLAVQITDDACLQPG